MAHIYVVDDDDQLLRMVGLMLERGGHTATLISSSIEALELIKEEVPDLAILDVMMPGMNGLELCRELRADSTTRDLPIIILTARGPAEDRTTAFEGGADEYLTKPVTSGELLENVEHLLNNRHLSSNGVDSDHGDDNPKGEASGPEPVLKPLTLSLLGFSGGCGRTTLAVNIAGAMRVTHDQPVYLLDFTASGGQSAMHMRLQPRSNWSNLDSTSNLSWSDLQSQMIEHPSGINILAAPIFPTNPNALSTDLAQRIISLLEEQNGIVVVDLPAYFSPMVRDILNMSHVVYHVINPDVISVQTAVRAERTLQEANVTYGSKRHFVLNHPVVDPQLSQPTVERGLNTKIDYVIHFDPNQSRALAQGAPLTLAEGASPLPTVAKRIAAEVVENVLA